MDPTLTRTPPLARGGTITGPSLRLRSDQMSHSFAVAAGTICSAKAKLSSQSDERRSSQAWL